MDGVLIGFIVFMAGAFALIFICWVRHKDDYEKRYYKEANYRCLTPCPKRTDGVMIGSSVCGECVRFGGNNDVDKYVLCLRDENVEINEIVNGFSFGNLKKSQKDN